MEKIFNPKTITKENFSKFGDLITTKDIKPISINDGYAKRFNNIAELDTSKVLVLSTVEVKNKANGAQMKYTLVAQSEADLKSGKISVDSPIGKGLLGKKVGDIAIITVPNGSIELEIVSIARN